VGSAEPAASAISLARTGSSVSFAKGIETEPQALGPWRISAAKVSVREGWMPADPLLTWHNTQPFQADPSPPVEEPETPPQPAEPNDTPPTDSKGKSSRGGSVERKGSGLKSEKASGAKK
jgi:hypothetical protein